jgi:C-terminal processing protease CtpA/Prc
MFSSAFASTLHMTVKGIDAKTLYVVGETPPLSMTRPTPMIRKGDTFTLSVWLPNVAVGESVRFKFAQVTPTTLMQPNKISLEPLQGLRSIKLTQSNTYSTHTYGVPDPLTFSEVDTFTPSQLQADLAILNEALETLHPGLFRYMSEADWASHKAQLNQQFKQAKSVKDTYLAITQYVAAIQCGHTHTGIYNQSAFIDQLLQGSADKMPLLFTNQQGRWYLTHNVSGKSILTAGTEILTINNTPVGEIIETMLPYMSADGANDANRMAQIALYPVSTWQMFDAYFPLLFGEPDQPYKLKVRLANSQQPIFIDVPAVTLAERTRRLEALNLPEMDINQSWLYRITEDGEGYLRIGTYATYKMSLDWQAFYAEAFAAFADAKVDNIIVDIRGNVGGMDNARLTLDAYLGLTDLPNHWEHFSRYQVVPESLKPYLNTWDNSILDISDITAPAQNSVLNGFKLMSPQSPTLPSVTEPYTGKITLLVDGTNASATFYQAYAYQNHPRVTVKGETTGGNLRGINGGAMFFLTLPNTQIEVDIPLYASFPKDADLDAIPNRGIVPEQSM